MDAVLKVHTFIKKNFIPLEKDLDLPLVLFSLKCVDNQTCIIFYTF